MHMRLVPIRIEQTLGHARRWFPQLTELGVRVCIVKCKKCKKVVSNLSNNKMRV